MFSQWVNGSMNKHFARIMAACVVAMLVFPACQEQNKTTSQIQAIPATGENPATGSRIGNMAPDFNLQDTDGNTLKLSGFRGRPVLLNFWAIN
jgi:cytochrome oxidase Cu insertion factor (SCO1/SenC/PrrC family)